jgi:hypothetical protein
VTDRENADRALKEWGEKHGIALFQFTLRGEVKAISKKAKELLEGV